MPVGFILGVLLGTGLASLMARAKRAEAPGAEDSVPDPNQLLARIKLQIREAKDAGKEASREKQEELLRDYEESMHRPSQERQES